MKNMAVDLNYYKKKDIHGLYLSLGFFGVIIFITIALYFFNIYTNGKNEELQQKLTSLESSVSELKKDKNIESYYIYSQNTEAFAKLEKDSQVSAMIEHLTGIMLKYDLAFDSFQYSNGEVKLSTKTTSENLPAFKKVVKFVEDYSQRDDALFTVKGINEFTGYDQINFPLTLELK